MLISERDLRVLSYTNPVFKILKSKFALGDVSKPLCDLFMLSADSSFYRLSGAMVQSPGSGVELPGFKLSY